MTEITRHALRIYSSVAALKGDGADVLDALVPFFVPILQVMDRKIFDPSLFALGVRKMYHWHFTREVAEHFIPRLVRLGYLKEHKEGDRAVYAVVMPPLAETQEEREIQDVIEEIITELVDFSKQVSDLFVYSKSREELTDILVRFLVSDQFSLADAREVDTTEESDDPNLNALEDGGRPLSDDDRYMAARFVDHIVKEKPGFLPHLSRLASVGLLAEVVEDFVRPTSQVAHVETTIALDAPLALDYLGLSGKATKEDVRAVFDSLKAIGCKLVVFPVTCAEMTRNLSSMLKLSSPERYGPTHHALLKKEIMKDYVEAVAANPEEALSREGIQVKPMDLKSFPALHKHFDQERYEDFFAEINWVGDVRPREHDATCTALVMRLRAGKHSSDVFKCEYTFATRNPTFTRKSKRYCVESRLIYPSQEGPVVHQRELATVAWLRTGLGAKYEIPSKSLLAHCDRVLRVRPEVTAAVKKRLASITPDSLQQFDLLLHDQRSLRKLADATLNNEKIITGENAEQLLELMKEAAIAEKTAEFEATLQGAEERNKRDKLAAAKERKRLLSEREEDARRHKEELEAIAGSHRALLAQQTQAKEALISHVNRRQKALGWGVTLAVVALGIAAAVSGLAPTPLPLWAKVPLLGFAVLAAYYVVADALHWPKAGMNNLLDWSAQRLLRKELQRRGLSYLAITDFHVENGSVAPTEPSPTLQLPLSAGNSHTEEAK